MSRLRILLAFFLVFPVKVAADPIPLVAAFSMQTANGKLVDSGPLHYDGQMQNVTVSPEGHPGPSLHFDGPTSQVTIDGPFIQKLASDISLTAWIKIERFPTGNSAIVMGKGGNQGFQLELGHNRAIFLHGFWGGWYDGPWGGTVAQNEWTHLAFTFKKGGEGRVYINGTQVAVQPAPHAFWPVGDPFKLGGSDWAGLLDEVHIYARELAPEDVKQDMQGVLPDVRAPATADFPAVEYPIHAALVRFDEPLGNAEFLGRSRQTALRVPGPDAVDWPQLSLRTPNAVTPLWEKSAEQDVTVPLPPAEPLFRQPWDNVIEPVDKWFRAQPWIWGQVWVYTTDFTARVGGSDYELWTFPVRVQGPGEADIHQVTLSLDGKNLYSRTESLHSLTLLLPQNPDGRPYELSVNGRGPVKFSTGLQPGRPGDPQFTPIPVDLDLPGPGPRIHAANLAAPAVFPNLKEWDEDMKALTAGSPVSAVPVLSPPATTPLPVAISLPSGSISAPLAAWTRRVGIEAPVSPVSLFAVNMSAGMSSGFGFESAHLTGFQGSMEEYAAHLASMGFDRVFEKASDSLLAQHPEKYDAWFNAMAAQGVGAGLNVEGPIGQAGMLGSPNMAFYSYNLPEWHAPLYRDYSILTQRFMNYPAFAGIFTGADNAGYVPYWDWAPPIPNRPWGKAFAQWMRGQPAQTPVGPALSPAKDYEIRGTERQFIDYIHRYDQTFRQYGYFAQAVREVNPGLIFTSGSFGSGPGVGARGGWPWASIPGQPLFSGLSVQTAYDWNETEFSKPMQNAALIDRLHSYYPDKTTWSIIDNFGLFSSREALQRNCALALTRGVQGIGTNSLAHTTGKEDAPGLNHPGQREQKVADQKEISAWIHRFGGAFSGTRPLATIGILYVHDQAISRPIVGGAEPGDPIYQGSHEGKTTEALFLCEAAGWPARIITPNELWRDLMPTSIKKPEDPDIKVLLLTGLNRFDNTWSWYDDLTPVLQRFTARGGQILLDDESVCPVKADKSGLRIAAYIPQGINFAPLLFDRNRDNIVKLNTAMQGINRPFVLSGDPTIWAIPTQTGDVQYATVVNFGYVEGQNASIVVKPQTGELTWKTHRTIYLLPGVGAAQDGGAAQGWGRQMTQTEAGSVDLTHSAFQVFALPPSPPTAPRMEIGAGPDGFYYAAVSDGAPNMKGVPVEVTVSKAGGKAVLYGVSGTPLKLPVTRQDPGKYDVEARELLTGLVSRRTFNVSASVQPPEPGPRSLYLSALTLFERRKTPPLVIALTPGQAKDPLILALAQRLIRRFRTSGRTVSLDTIEPGHVVRSLQPQKSIQRYPRWLTVDADLVLLGSPRDNLLLLDEARGFLIPGVIKSPGALITRSPFVGEYNVLNILANDTAGLIGMD